MKEEWSTLYRAPQMHAESGAWLEGFSKRDAQAILIALPWTVLLSSLTCFMVLYALEAGLHLFLVVFERVVNASHYLIALGCALYVPVALLVERPSSCCRSGPRRSKEGWIAIGAVAACAVIALCYANSVHSLPDRKLWISFIHGSFAFRAATTGEFLLQIAWLWSAAGLRCEKGQSVPSWRRWSYSLLVLLWSFTWWVGDDQQLSVDDIPFFLGYSARVILFVYCVTRVFRKCARHCQCCCFCCRDEWVCLENLPCTPGRERLRYLLFYLLTRPPFLLIMNLPLGYPLAFLATWALLVRCGLILLIALSLRPAPTPVEEHEMERSTREQFDVLLALHLCDFSWETYQGAPVPAVVVISGCGHPELNGEYTQEGRDQNDFPIYKRDLPQHMERQAFLQNTDGVWEVVTKSTSSASSTSSDERWVYAEAESAETPTQVQGVWSEMGFKEGEEKDCTVSNAKLKITTGPGEAKRHHSVSGGCPLLDVQWLLAEQMGNLTSEVQDGVPGVSQSSSGSTEDRSAEEVSIVVAFRGTQSVKNMLTDARISLQPLAEESKTGPFGLCEGPVACFDLEAKVVTKLGSAQGTPLNPFSPLSGAADPLQSTTGSAASLGGQEDAGLPGCCRLLAQCCTKLFFPFVPSDEDDDEELSLEVLENIRVHRGFAEAYGAIRSDVLAILKARLDHWQKLGVTTKVFATGHSMGGAIANLFASLPFDRPVVVYTFGAPRAGNAAFRSVYNALVPQTFRVVASRDVVPTLPPSIAYRQIGKEVWVDDAGELTFVMSWAMRHILPARDSVWYHPMLAYYRLLNRALLRKTGRPFPSRFRGESTIQEALNGKPLSS
ncbi:unnamed protein product [Durusdinium trenchii]|uniref:Fungal lipase-type domain-containing protein n=1 Tax=Durusdinium trenchii TaxID=1381693 RepID=A0ABP0I8C5_9DINO